MRTERVDSDPIDEVTLKLSQEPNIAPETKQFFIEVFKTKAMAIIPPRQGLAQWIRNVSITMDYYLNSSKTTTQIGEELDVCPTSIGRRINSTMENLRVNLEIITGKPMAKVKTAKTGLRGFGGMKREIVMAISSKGGKASHDKGVAYRFTPEKAREAGTIGGKIISQKRDWMAEIGRKGGSTPKNKKLTSTSSS